MSKLVRGIPSFYTPFPLVNAVYLGITFMIVNTSLVLSGN